MFIDRMFRERALQRRGRQEPLDDRLQITAPHEWLIVAGLGGMLVVLVVFAVFGRFDRIASYDGALILPGERHYLVAPVSGIVVDVLEDETNEVAPGQPIAYIQPSERQYLESALVRFLNDLVESGQLPEGSRTELLQVLRTLSSYPGFAHSAEVVSPDGGEVVRLDLAPGQTVVAGAFVGLVRTEAVGQPEIVAFVSPDEAARLSVGMKAQVSIVSPGRGTERVFQGRVAHVSPSEVKPPQWLLGQGLTIPQQPHRLRVALENGELDFPMADVTSASLRVALGRESLVSLLALKDGG